ncbi:MAG: peptide chain release factor N(5)-glutamine methyltransferase [Eubacterium sp.]|nr:peptide chain release factor N(5)-glutamine methyltransferase [Eubacterium sp.]
MSDIIVQRSDKTISGVINRAARMLDSAGIDNSTPEARHLLSVILDEDLSSIYARLKDELDEFTIGRYMHAIKKRTTHYPFQYLIGFTYFMDYKFICRENVLIPRYDSELAVLNALEMGYDRNMKVMDLCTGSGCIGISYELERHKDGYDDEVTLVDISDDALKLSADNAEALGANVRIAKSDMFEAFRDENGKAKEKFDAIISNPPYIRSGDIAYLMKEVRDFEPKLALDGTRDGLAFYRTIASETPDFLKEGGYLVLEIGSEQYLDVRDMLKAEGFSDIRVYKDMNNLDRVVTAYL